ncbi:fatty acid hydroxylase [Infundibulicybe gibba]|nr:fatty acid hydroxylase [Infundibulicybe gibba]
MDLVLEILDEYVLDKVWAKLVPLSAFAHSPEIFRSMNSSMSMPIITSASKWSQMIAYLPHPDIHALSSSPHQITEISAWPREYVPRQLTSLFVNQVKLEIQTSLRGFLGMTLLTLPWFQAEVMGYSRLYDRWDSYGIFYAIASIPFFLFFTDYCIYWIHRWLHIPFLYKIIHKPHHKWIIPTPFASHAFHPLDGYAQSLPYHFFIFLFPLHRLTYLGLFVFVNFWSIFIHDSDMITGHPLEKIINGPAHHTLHHIYFTVNYGQYFTWADRAGNSYRQPESHLDPMLEVPTEKAALGKQQ